MSLATMCALILGAVLLFVFKCHTLAAVLFLCCVVFMIIRHRENILRLKEGTESRFSFKSS